MRYNYVTVLRIMQLQYKAFILYNNSNNNNTILSAKTMFVNMLLEGKYHPDVIPILFGGNLTASVKKTGGVRPIAVGYTWRRVAAKIMR